MAVSEVPVCGLEPHLDLGEARIHEPLFCLVEVLAEAETMVIVQDALGYFFSQALQGASEDADLSAVLHAAPGGDAGAGTRLQHSVCLLNLLLRMLDKHEREAG